MVHFDSFCRSSVNEPNCKSKVFFRCLQVRTSKKLVTLHFQLENNENVNLILEGNNLSRVDNHEFIGVMNEVTLKVVDNMNKVCTNVSQSTGVIRRVSNTLPDNALHKLYYIL